MQKLTLFLCLVFVLNACKNAAPVSSIDDYTGIIVGHTGSPVSRCGEIYIDLGFPVDTSLLTNDLLTFDPPLQGTLVPGNTLTRLVYKNADIKHNVRYTASFRIGDLIDLPKDMHVYRFSLESMRQTWDLQLEPPVGRSMDEVFYNGKVKFVDCEPDPSIFYNTLTAQQGEVKLDIKWQLPGDARECEFTIMGARRGDEPSEVIVTFNMEALNVDDNIEFKLPVPSKRDFSLYGIKLHDNRHIEVTFTDPLNSTQDLTGLIAVAGREIQQFKINHNKVDIYFREESFGKFELKTFPGIRNAANFSLMDEYTRDLFFAPPVPDVHITVDGNILPPSGAWKVPVSLTTATGFRLRVLEVPAHNAHRFYQENTEPYQSQLGLENIGRIVLDTTYSLDIRNVYETSSHILVLDGLVKRKEGSIYKLVLSIPREHNKYPCEDNETGTAVDIIDSIDFDYPHLTYSYNYYYYYLQQLGRVSYQDQRNSDPQKIACQNYRTGAVEDQRILVCSNTGVVIKSSPESDTYHAFVSGITYAEPLTGAHVELTDFQGNLLVDSWTNSSGFATLSTDRVPFLAKVSSGNNVTFVPMRNARALSLSAFQVEGKQWESANRIFFYGDRDVWRPGDTVFMQAIAYDPARPLPEELPVRLKLYDPTNKLVREWNVKGSNNGLYDCRFATAIEATTGIWRLELALGGTRYDTPVRIETVRPNRMKIQMDFADPDIVQHNMSLAAPISVKWMHGLPATGIKTEVVMFQEAQANPFGENYAGYLFDDITNLYQRDLGVVASDVTDDTGHIEFAIPAASVENYPGQMLLNFELRAFEPGGGFSMDMKPVLYSPFSEYAGMKFTSDPQSGTHYILDDEAIQLIVLDEKGSAVPSEIEIAAHRIKSEWWYQVHQTGDLSVIRNATTYTEFSERINLPREGKTIQLPVRGGFYLLTVKSIASGHKASRVVYVYKGGSWRDEDSETISHLEVLPVRLEKTSYEVGEYLEYTLPLHATGRYYATVESGGNVLYQQQFAANGEQRKIRVAITPEMMPTAYLHIHYIQSWQDSNNDRPIRMFGLQPIAVFDPATVLKPRIEIADEIETDREFKVEISESQGMGMTYTLAVVDEGLLDLTQFSTPNPWAAFFSKEGLSVRTWDMYRDVFRRFDTSGETLLAVGGDGSAAINPTASARRFKPVVKFLGPFVLKPGKRQTHTLTISEYVGSVRTMVVATNGKAVGHSSATSKVKKPLMLYSSLPRVLGPDESLKLPVTVFAMNDAITDVSIELQSENDLVTFADGAKSISFSETGERDIAFEIRTGSSTGIARLRVEATAGDYRAVEKVEIAVRPSSPEIVTTIDEIIGPGRKVEIQYEPVGMQGSQSAGLTVSKGFNFAFKPHVDWLMRYPHGCLEQSVSSAFPQIYLDQLNLLDDQTAMLHRQNFHAVIQRLRFMQVPEGGFTYWPGGNIVNDWGTTYALHFLVEADRLGYDVPKDMLSKCIQYQYKTAESWQVRSYNNSRYLNDREELQQAYRLYTLVLAGKPNYAGMNRLRLVPQMSATPRWMLAHALQLVGEESAASSMIPTESNIKHYREMGGTFGSNIRDQAIIIRILLERGDRLKAKRLIDELTPFFADDKRWRLSTQDVAQCLMSFALFARGSQDVDSQVPVSVATMKDVRPIDTTISDFPLEFEAPIASNTGNVIEIENHGESELFSSLALKGIPARDESNGESQDLVMDVKYYSGNEEIDPSKVPWLMDIIMQVQVKHPGERMDYENLALTAIFPSGWEIINQRMGYGTSGDLAVMPEVDHLDIRDDRVYAYFGLKKGEKKTFRFKLNAAYAGKYWAPPVFCEAMYDPSVRAKNKGFWTEIVKNDDVQ